MDFLESDVKMHLIVQFHASGDSYSWLLLMVILGNVYTAGYAAIDSAGLIEREVETSSIDPRWAFQPTLIIQLLELCSLRISRLPPVAM